MKPARSAAAISAFTWVRFGNRPFSAAMSAPDSDRPRYWGAFWTASGSVVCSPTRAKKSTYSPAP